MTELGSIRDLLREHGLDHVREEPFPNDGWSGASMTLLRRGGGDRFVLKRDSLARDWIARATNDGPVLREAWFASRARMLEEPTLDRVRAPYLGAARDQEEFAILMPDLSGALFDWSTPVSIEQLEEVLAALAALHADGWGADPGWTPPHRGGMLFDPAFEDGGPWCPLLERISLISRASLERPGPAREAVAERLLPGWDAFDRIAETGARDLVAMLADDPGPLLDALAAQPSTLIHGDLKLANVGIASDGAVEIVDWQMVSLAPIAVELGWFLVSNVSSLPLPPDEILAHYGQCLEAVGIDRSNEGWPPDPAVWLDQDAIDAAMLVGLLLRGWRKGYDAEAGVTLASGVSAADDLAWWCERAVEAADRIL
jgi:hypothetical protein